MTDATAKTLLTPDQRRQLTVRSDAMGAWAIISTWAAIAAAFALLAWALSLPPLWRELLAILALALLGGRQLALAIVTHEASHRTLFKTRWANERLVDWLCARPIGLDLEKYRQHHFAHHAHTGTEADSDLSLIQGLPTSRRGLLRKFARDLSGVTGLKFLLGRVLLDAELMKWTVSSQVTWLPRQRRRDHLRHFLRNASPMLLCNGLLLTVLALLGRPELYLGWLLAYLIPYPLFIRIRALAEHACTEASDHPLKNTRTTRAGWLARIFVAPLRVNYHQEHHLMASVPWFRLKALHRQLRQQQAVAPAPSYWQVLHTVSSRKNPR